MLQKGSRNVRQGKKSCSQTQAWNPGRSGPLACCSGEKRDVAFKTGGMVPRLRGSMPEAARRSRRVGEEDELERISMLIWLS